MTQTYVATVKEDSSLPFEPDASQRIHTPLFNRGFTPRYLFRLVAPQTAGRTTSSTVVSPAAASRSPQDIFSLPTREAATHLLNHLLWQRGHESNCNLMSWTSSLLFTLQYALYRHNKDGEDLSRIVLVILDTRNFPQGTFIQDMEIMRAFAGVNGGLQKFLHFREGEYYFGEYLTQGKMDIRGRCVCTSIQKMIDLGLFTLQPGLADHRYWGWWSKRVLELRKLFLGNRAIPTREEHVDKAVRIAEQCFGGGWTVPCAVMFLALQPRKRDDMVFAQGFKERFTVDEIKAVSLHDMKIDGRALPEVAQFKALIDLLHHDFGISDVDALLGSVERLSVLS